MLAVDPRRRLSLDDIMIDPWFKQYLPDISKMVVAPAKEVQSEEQVLAVLAQAESLSEARRLAKDEFTEEAMADLDDVIEEMGAESQDLTLPYGGNTF